MTDEHDFGIGARIRYYRERRGLSQKAMAELVGKSENWAYKVEKGVLPIDRLSVLIDLARVLHIRDLTDLTGGVLTGAVSGPQTEHEAVPAIRRVLSLPSSLLPSGIGEVPVGEYQAAVNDAWHVYETQTKDRYADIGGRLPSLLRQGYAAVRDADGEEQERQAVALLISVYAMAQVWLRRVGEPVQARVAADRGVALADQVGDPALLAAATWSLACVLTSTGDVGDCVALAREAIANCRPGEDASAEHLSAYGALHLSAAVAAVRDNQGPVAWDLYHGAERVAVRLGHDRNDWHTSFGPTNVAMHAVHLRAEEGDTVEALRVADGVEDNPALPLERRTRYLIEVMNCNRIQRDDYATVYMLKRITSQSPEEVGFSPLVREAVADLLKRERPMWRQDLRAVAAHIGMTG
ncbi:helix-turn-helix domain-containing protein [Actinacidiphila bryophytorum]|uniref:helix-turn-helix domain-containing protein n=1 Tax=Actinacidiphila bryophytorum TaxID=1436133 RepID=UPI002176C921|nr:helix-turn-helix transcriptional regulator [Actinacidiphila bryophytorum]UWE08699.1 helix-turn-helix domain-containing protein [Actinacidiphila bryophytorum]